MEQPFMSELVTRKNSPPRKPLILNEARQVSRMRPLKELGRRRFDGAAHINLDANPAYASSSRPAATPHASSLQYNSIPARPSRGRVRGPARDTASLRSQNDPRFAPGKVLRGSGSSSRPASSYSLLLPILSRFMTSWAL